MGLKIAFGRVRISTTGTIAEPSWRVDHTKFSSVAMHGFGRKRDAELALCALKETGINWEEPSWETHLEEWLAFGGKQAIEKFVCSHLQW